MNKEELGKRVKAARRVYETINEEDLTQAKLAKKIGVSRSYIGDIESGRTYPTMTFLFAIVDTLKIPIEYLVSENFNLKNYIFQNGSNDLAKRIEALSKEKQQIIESIIESYESDSEQSAINESVAMGE